MEDKSMRPILALIALFTSACMLRPVDGAVGAPGDTLTLSGYESQPGSTLVIQNHQFGSWLNIATTTTSTTATPYGGQNFYAWSSSVSLPYWTAGTTGQVARIAVQRADGSYAITVRPDVADCFNLHPGLNDFFDHCRSPHSPEAYVYTSNYPATADLVIDGATRSTSHDEVVVWFHNGGRHGRVTGAGCSLGDAVLISESLDIPLKPGDSGSAVVRLAVESGDTVTCGIEGTNEDGTPECPAGNCDNNRLTTWLF
jgi:hypothetical protein